MKTPTTLSEWEHYLRPRFAAVQLIGELNLTEEQTRQIGALIRGLLRNVSLAEANRRLEQHYPCTLATYLVFTGVYEYHDHQFWSSVCEATGLPRDGMATSEWGQIFETVLDAFALKRHFGSRTYRFVAPILGHGGIPIDCLPTFFARMVQPAVEDPYQVNLSTANLVHRWKTDSLRIGVVKPIQRFLDYGGQLAID